MDGGDNDDMVDDDDDGNGDDDDDDIDGDDDGESNRGRLPRWSRLWGSTLPGEKSARQFFFSPL